MHSVRKVLKKEDKTDMLITVAIPHTIHWGAAWAKTSLKEKFPKLWIADCGDPFMGNKFQNHLFYFKYFEKWFCKKADYISVPVEEAKEAYYKEFHEKIRIIPQGFEFKSINIEDKFIKNKKPTFLYAGAFYKGIRDPELLLNYLSKLDIDFKFYVYTRQKHFLDKYKKILGDKIEINDYIPREKLLLKMSTVDFLINLENGTEIQSPSKLIDYALTKKPILSIPSSKIDKVEIKRFLNGNYTNQLKIDNIEQYNIKNVTKSFLILAN